MAKVALVRCESYDREQVKAGVRRGFELLGGARKFCNEGEKILLKPNLLAGEPPEKCVTTHPEVFRAAAEILLEAGAKVTYGDSPAVGSPLVAAQKAGLQAEAEELGIEFADFENGEDVIYEEGRQNKKFYIAKGVLESEGVISLPKLKTHAFQRMTGSIKNQFGCIPGTLKGEFHARIPDTVQFAKMMVDLDMYVNPRLYIMDGIFAMEGNGPRGGNPKQMNIILMSADPVALDATVCRLIDLDPHKVPSITIGEEFGHGVYKEEDVEIVGESLESFRDGSFDVDKGEVKNFALFGFLRFISPLITPKPIIVEKNCIKCGLCIKICPVKPKAVDWPQGDKTRVPVYRYKDCIRCYCCQELCPEKAIILNKPPLRRLISKS